MTNSAKLLREYATHLGMHDWNYTRDIGDLKYIRYGHDTSGHQHWTKRLRRVISDVFGKNNLARYRKSSDPWYSPFLERAAMVRVHWVPEDHRPDGVLDGGSIITFWEEDGEYIQLVQRSVGVLLADFLEDEPDNPHAEKILAELDRIRSGYRQRLAEEAS